MHVVRQPSSSPMPPWLAGALLRAGPGAPRPANPDQEPIPGGNVPTELPPAPPDEIPDTGPTGPRTPYPVSDPGIAEPTGPGSEPDYLPGRPTSPMQV
ncbi:MAG TPA: hypothetical protein PKD06_16425 [Enterovirga sp.]|nr:hypothetical protein [Enterovirga sp.]